MRANPAFEPTAASGLRSLAVPSSLRSPAAAHLERYALVSRRLLDGAPMYIRAIVAVMSVVSIASCGTTALSRDEITEVDAGKKAILRTYNQPILAGLIFGDQPVTKIISVEGMNKKDVELLKLDEAMAVDVGLRRISLSCSNRAREDERDSTEIIEIDFKPYHEYLVRCSFDSAYSAGGSYATSFSVEERRLK